MIGIVLAGGSGTRLFPLTKAVSKQLLPVFDKPMIHYPIATLMLAGIREILIITTPQDLANFRRLLGDGRQYGVEFTYVIQPEPKGISQAFTLTRHFIKNKKTALILGDNVFHGTSLGSQLGQHLEVEGAQIFGYQVANPSDYGVASLSPNGDVVEIVEKPVLPLSNLAVPGLYFYDESVLEKAMQIETSARGELEITAINQMYLNEGRLKLDILPRGTIWLDAGTPEGLLDSSNLVKLLQERQGQMIGCIEEVGIRNGWIDAHLADELIKRTPNAKFSSYIAGVASEVIG